MIDLVALQHVFDQRPTTEDEIAILAVLLAVGAHIPAHPGIDQCMWGDQASFWLMFCAKRPIH
ncbi:hypothetical protein D3C77_786500 [compost metagenome]